MSPLSSALLSLKLKIMQLTPVAQAVQQLCYEIALAAWLKKQQVPQPQIVLDDAK